LLACHVPYRSLCRGSRVGLLRAPRGSALRAAIAARRTLVNMLFVTCLDRGNVADVQKLYTQHNILGIYDTSKLCEPVVDHLARTAGPAGWPRAAWVTDVRAATSGRCKRHAALAIRGSLQLFPRTWIWSLSAPCRPLTPVGRSLRPVLPWPTTDNHPLPDPAGLEAASPSKDFIPDLNGLFNE
jgi:hypothetical protein